MVQIHDIQPVYCFLFNTTELLERSVSLSLLWEGVCQDVPIPLCVSLALLVRRPEHLGQDVGGAECGLHLPLCEIISLPPSVHLLAVRSETFQCEYIQITSFHSISPQSRSILFSLIYSQNLQRSSREFAFQFSKYRTHLRFEHSSVRVTSRLNVRCLK